MRSKEKVRSFLQESFPQLDIDDLVTEEELERFALSEGGVFPRPQHSKALQHSFFSSSSNSSSSVVLLGDAAHAFPPDLGQGLNSALEDVYQLHNSLVATKNSKENCSREEQLDIPAALRDYEARRLPDIKALIQLMIFGFPYQYNQAPLKKNLAYFNFALRLLLNKILPAVFSPASFFMLQDEKLSYSYVVAAGKRTTRNLLLSLGGLLAASLWGLKGTIMKLLRDFKWL